MILCDERTQAKEIWNLNTPKWKVQIFYFVAAFSKYSRYALILCVPVYKLNIADAAVHCNLNVVGEKFSLTNTVISRNRFKIICK